jgi:hypothetical protein
LNGLGKKRMEIEVICSLKLRRLLRNPWKSGYIKFRSHFFTPKKQ